MAYANAQTMHPNLSVIIERHLVGGPSAAQDANHHYTDFGFFCFALNLAAFAGMM